METQTTRREENIYRVIDANLNRAVEGIRVVEDTARFLCDDGELFAELRKLRHSLRESAGKLPGGRASLLKARASESDVGRDAEHIPKKGTRELLTSNLNRAQEAVRVLEECAGTLSPASAKTFASVRFRLYDLEKEIAAHAARLGREKASLPPPPFLYVIGGLSDLLGKKSEYLRSALRGGAAVVQLREKDADDRRILQGAERISAAAGKSVAITIVNDRTDIALAARADGVHLGDGDLPVSAAAKLAEGKLLIGVSTHSLRQALRAAEDEPDYISLGPVFQSPTKPGRNPLGLRALERVCRKTPFPVVAIGGINEKNVGSVLSAGAAGAAMISAPRAAENPEAYLKKIISDFPEK